jgi:hypothetical protein
MPNVRIADLLHGDLAEPRHLDEGRVEHYGDILDRLPPVVAFDTGEGLLLADGYHRAVAARRRGRRTIEAEVRRGTRHDALEYALSAGQSGGCSRSREELLRRIGDRYPERRPDEAMP